MWDLLVTSHIIPKMYQPFKRLFQIKQFVHFPLIVVYLLEKTLVRKELGLFRILQARLVSKTIFLFLAFLIPNPPVLLSLVTIFQFRRCNFFFSDVKFHISLFERCQFLLAFVLAVGSIALCGLEYYLG